MIGSNAPMWVSCPVFAIQIVGMFFDGKENFPWPKRWLSFMGIYFLIICSANWVMETLQWWPQIPLLPLLVIISTAIPCIFSLCITKEIVGSPSKSISIFPSVLIVWSCLSLAYFCGRMISKLNPKKDRSKNSICFIYRNGNSAE